MSPTPEHPAISVAIVSVAEAHAPAILGHVVEEVVDDIRRDDVTDVLGLAVLVRVKGSGEGLGSGSGSGSGSGQA